jgi:cytochrome c5
MRTSICIIATLMKNLAGVSLLLLLQGLQPAAAETGRPGVNTLHGMRVFNRVCSECHYDGKNGAPRLNDISAWRTRIFQGEEVLDQHALQGYLTMPSKGGHPELSDQDVIDAVHYVIIMLRDEPTR